MDRDLVAVLSKVAQTKHKDFNPQGISNLLWALATAGLVPDTKMTSVLLSQAVSQADKLNTQDLCNILWATAVFGGWEKGADAGDGMTKLLNRAVQQKEALDGKGQAQLHQVFVANSLREDPVDVCQFDDLAAECKKAFLDEHVATKSKLQKDVALALTKIGQEFVEEQVLEEVGYSVDVRLVDRKVVMEVDGPSHYVGMEKGRHWNGATRLKHGILTKLGWTVVHVPYFDWNPLKGTKAKEEYVKRLLSKCM